MLNANFEEDFPANEIPLKPSATANWELITPEEAKKLLGTMKRNRTLQPNAVDRFALDMVKGNWAANGETVKIDWTGNLLDGQHRLHAVIESGKAQWVLVVRGLDPKSITTMDTGTTRTLAQALGLAEYKNVTALGSVVKLCVIWDRNQGLDSVQRLDHRNSVSISEGLDWVASHPDIHDVVKSITTLKSKWGPKSAVGFCIYQFSQVDSEAAAVFLESFKTGSDLASTDPILKLRSVWEDIKAMDNSDVRPVHFVSLMFRTWNKWNPVRDLEHPGVVGDRTPSKMRNVLSWRNGTAAYPFDAELQK